MFKRGKEFTDVAICHGAMQQLLLIGDGGFLGCIPRLRGCQEMTQAALLTPCPSTEFSPLNGNRYFLSSVEAFYCPAIIRQRGFHTELCSDDDRTSYMLYRHLHFINAVQIRVFLGSGSPPQEPHSSSAAPSPAWP